MNRKLSQKCVFLGKPLSFMWGAETVSLNTFLSGKLFGVASCIQRPLVVI